MGKAIKNYTTKVPAGQSINEIQVALVQAGASGVLYEWEQGTGLVSALKFILLVNDQRVGFALPVEWRKFQAVLKKQNVPRAHEDAYAYRVAWRCIRDWVLSQLALYETEIVELPQVFLPFAVGRDGGTLYDQIAKGGFLLGDGSQS